MLLNVLGVDPLTSRFRNTCHPGGPTAKPGTRNKKAHCCSLQLGFFFREPGLAKVEAQEADGGLGNGQRLLALAKHLGCNGYSNSARVRSVCNFSTYPSIYAPNDHVFQCIVIPPYLI